MKDRYFFWYFGQRVLAGLRGFLFCGIGAVLLAPFWFFPVQHGIRSFQTTRIHHLPQHSRELVAFLITPENPVKWVERGREFFFEGMMYDIHSSERSGDTLKVLALADPAEAFWVRIFFSIGQEVRSPGNTLFFFLFYYVEPLPEAMATLSEQALKPLLYYSRVLPETFPVLPVPPPEGLG